MSCEVLSIKLCQLDDRLTRLHSRIHISETANQNQLQQEICAMKQECVDSETALQESLRHSKSGLVCVLGQGYRQIEQILQNTKKQLQVQVSDNFDTETATEKKILLAEYALDFAHQAADRALLLSMEAIEAQLLQIKKGESHERS